MARLLLRVGMLLIAGVVLYAVLGETVFGGVDNRLAKTILIAGGICLAAGFVALLAGRATAGLVARGCPRCGRRVARGRVYCDEHLQETINEYRDQNRDAPR